MASRSSEHRQHERHKECCTDKDANACMDFIVHGEAFMRRDPEKAVDWDNEKKDDKDCDEESNEKIYSPPSAVMYMWISCFHSVLGTTEDALELALVKW